MAKYQSMKCKDCVLKHLAAAMSYGKEIISGHGQDGTPDHRPDFLGELVNAEHHLAQMSAELLNKVMVIRTAAQNKHMTPSEEDIDQLREIWIEADATDFNVAKPPAPQPAPAVEAVNKLPEPFDRPVAEYPGLDAQDSVGFLLDRKWDEFPERKELFLKMAGKLARNADGFFGRDGLEGYDKEWLWYVPVNVFIANGMDALTPHPVYHDVNRPWNRLPYLVKVSAMKKALSDKPDYSEEYVMSFLDSSDRPIGSASEEESVVAVTRQPCCTLKTRLQTAVFVRVDDNGWPFMKKIWEDLYA